MADSQVDISDFLVPKASGNGSKIIKKFSESLEFVGSIESETHVIENSVKEPEKKEDNYCSYCAYTSRDTIEVNESNSSRHYKDFVPPKEEKKKNNPQ